MISMHAAAPGAGSQRHTTRVAVDILWGWLRLIRATAVGRKRAR
eukprot:CAMPEP_0183337912 /NCGR_PEP_ID=MMETSP0164_2-20130417/5394_1 /TAXON_ID=221442 /ORGANISM="Coccolithus pelagicus ssp braarudi, Strain PLY182g" /LENGTH=43 /DNA_ID= /DNA_START= /DNA_END= /DNA_ORIENTATION=